MRGASCRQHGSCDGGSVSCVRTIDAVFRRLTALGGDAGNGGSPKCQKAIVVSWSGDLSAPNGLLATSCRPDLFVDTRGGFIASDTDEVTDFAVNALRSRRRAFEHQRQRNPVRSAPSASIAHPCCGRRFTHGAKYTEAYGAGVFIRGAGRSSRRRRKGSVDAEFTTAEPLYVCEDITTNTRLRERAENRDLGTPFPHVDYARRAVDVPRGLHRRHEPSGRDRRGTVTSPRARSRSVTSAAVPSTFPVETVSTRRTSTRPGLFS